MTMKWSASGRASVLMTAAVAAAGGAGKDESGTLSPARKPVTVSFAVASPRAYLAGATRVRVADYSARAVVAENVTRPAENERFGN